MRLGLDDFFSELDQLWMLHGTEKILLRVIGSTALFVQTPYRRGTRDSDVLEIAGLGGTPRSQLEALAGPGTELHLRHGIYLDVVAPGVPLLPADPLWHPWPLDLRHFEMHVLDVADVVVSKLKRWSARDHDDVQAMVEGEHVTRERFLERLREVIERYRFDGRADWLPKMAERFNLVERDWFVVDETPFDFQEETFR